MIFDLELSAPGERHRGYDLCIAGGGVAGITLARDLALRGRRVLLLEAGGLDITEQSQNHYIGENIGRPYFALDTARLRYLGGTSNHWNGWCRPLDPSDFEKHEHIPHSGWPIRKSDLDPYLVAASEILELRSQRSADRSAEDFGGSFSADRVLEDSGDSFSEIAFRYSYPEVRFGTKYLQFLESNERIDVFLNANLVDVRMAGSRVTEFVCANYGEPDRRHSFTAKSFVLAMGGIENARMLLNFSTQNSAGIGNDQDLVGRFFMEHFHLSCGFYAADRDAWPFSTKEGRVIVAATPALRKTEKIGRAHV